MLGVCKGNFPLLFAGWSGTEVPSKGLQPLKNKKDASSEETRSVFLAEPGVIKDGCCHSCQDA
jgi:hypothetical protein